MTIRPIWINHFRPTSCIRVTKKVTKKEGQESKKVSSIPDPDGVNSNLT